MIFKAAGKTLTVGELREAMEELDPNAPVLLSNFENNNICTAVAVGQGAVLALEMADENQCSNTSSCSECYCDDQG